MSLSAVAFIDIVDLRIVFFVEEDEEAAEDLEEGEIKTSEWGEVGEVGEEEEKEPAEGDFTTGDPGLFGIAVAPAAGADDVFNILINKLFDVLAVFVA